MLGMRDAIYQHSHPTYSFLLHDNKYTPGMTHNLLEKATAQQQHPAGYHLTSHSIYKPFSTT